MQVWVSVNEADIGNIHPGQPVTFTVDAFPGHLSGGGRQGPTQCHHDPERRDLHRGGQHRQLRRQAPPLPDRQPQVHGGEAPRRTDDVKPRPPFRPPPNRSPGLPQPRPRYQAALVATTPVPHRKANPRPPGTLSLPGDDQVRPLSGLASLTYGSMTEVSSPDLQAGMPVVILSWKKGRNRPAPRPAPSPRNLQGTASDGIAFLREEPGVWRTPPPSPLSQPAEGVGKAGQGPDFPTKKTKGLGEGA